MAQKFLKEERTVFTHLDSDVREYKGCQHNIFIPKINIAGVKNVRVVITDLIGRRCTCTSQ